GRRSSVGRGVRAPCLPLPGGPPRAAPGGPPGPRAARDRGPPARAAGRRALPRPRVRAAARGDRRPPRRPVLGRGRRRGRDDRRVACSGMALVNVERDGEVVLMRLNRPPLNPLSAALLDELAGIV